MLSTIASRYFDGNIVKCSYILELTTSHAPRMVLFSYYGLQVVGTVANKMFLVIINECSDDYLMRARILRLSIEIRNEKSSQHVVFVVNFACKTVFLSLAVTACLTGRSLNIHVASRRALLDVESAKWQSILLCVVQKELC
jgi:hypothetical protein